jgi:hypothetical protein
LPLQPCYNGAVEVGTSMGKCVTEEEYDARIAIYGKAIRIEPYQGMEVKIDHRCLKHLEVHKSTPHSTLKGAGLSCCNISKIRNEEASGKYDDTLASIGKAERLEPYINNRTPIKHKCLVHNEVHLARPCQVIKGIGLNCCKRNPDSKAKAKETYDERLAKIGRVERLEEYVDADHKILHRCIEHREEHLASPRIVLSGKGLACCNRAKRLNNEARSKYDERLKSLGQVERLEPYVNLYTKISHRCLKHGQVFSVTPASVLNGFGLECCQVRKIKSKEIKERYPKILEERGRVKLVGEFVNMNTAVEHLCLLHNEVHISLPSNVIRGEGLICCRGFKANTFKELIMNQESPRDTCVYLHELSNYPRFLKLGISNQLHRRSLDPEYGDFITSWHTNSRLEAYCVEQAALRDVLIRRSCPDDLRTQNWPGYTEVISCSEDTAIDVIQFYWDEVDRLGPYQFALDYLNPTEEERQLLAVLN